MIGGFIGAPIGGVFNRAITATATQSLSIAQAASAQVLVSAAAAQPLSLAQSATAQVIVQAVASQPLGLNQSATAQVIVGASAAQALGIVQDVPPIRILPQPLGGWLPTPAELKRIQAEQRVWKREARERTQWLHAFEAELRSTYDKLTPKPPEPPRPTIIKRSDIAAPASTVPPADLDALLQAEEFARRKRAALMALLLAS